ncbi:MAG TPA: monofunctional biosynthetic peptidoglycan transglycosylase [Acidobacteriota bacterium]|nr:monofunctional biosynthetic peptidoglycan transglycosylase [Acidobacteriota bacterium]HQM64862.1 monofunctional biosynthetic peptidoglycan transglycosylase [Acidobacteriota bacterium]
MTHPSDDIVSPVPVDDRAAPPPGEPAAAAPPVKRSLARRVWAVAWKVALALLLVPPVEVAVLRFVDPPVTTVMLVQSAENLLKGRPAGWRHANVPAERVSPWLFAAVLAAEDQRFFDHHGFDLVEIENARDKHRRNPQRALRGASTVTQQVAKNLFLPPWRSFLRKGAEAYYTVWLELLWPKRRILEVYANVAEFAPGVYGAEAAARHHFRKSAARLTPREAALLAAVLPNPKRWNAARPTPYIQSRAAWIQNQFVALPREFWPRSKR